MSMRCGHNHELPSTLSLRDGQALKTEIKRHDIDFRPWIKSKRTSAERFVPRNEVWPSLQ